MRKRDWFLLALAIVLVVVVLRCREPACVLETDATGKVVAVVCDVDGDGVFEDHGRMSYEEYLRLRGEE